ncbi:MAG: DUF58 domain-containing protein [Bacteriovoracaceae bacterium]
MNFEEVRKVVGSIKANIFKNSNSYSIGMLKSHFRGTGLQFKEHQVYTHGDDIRHIDWKLLAKKRDPYIKTYEEERNVEIVVVIDTSATMLTGYKGVSKLQAAIEICCLLNLLAKETHDYVTPILVTDKLVRLPTSSGEKGIFTLVKYLEREKILNENGKINLIYNRNYQAPSEKILMGLLPELKRNKEIVLLSDFNYFLNKEHLEKILYRSHLHCFQILSPIDLGEKIPFSIFSITDYFSGKGKLNYIDSKEDKTSSFAREERFKTIKVHSRYLEDFVKEML